MRVFYGRSVDFITLRFFLIAGVMAVNGIGMGGDGDQAHLTDEERKAAALRIIRRAKRMALPGRDRAYSTCETGQFPQAIGGNQPPVPHKNSRKSRSGFGRGLPKKGKFQNLDRHKHYVLRVLKTSLWDSRCQTYVFKTKIA